MDLSVFLYVLGAFFVGLVLGQLQVINAYKDVLEKHLESEEVSSINSDILLLEKVEGYFCLYNVKDNRFVCQGKTPEELAENLARKMNYAKIVTSGTNDVLLFENGRIQNVNKNSN